MANVKISELTAITSSSDLASVDIVPIVDSSDSSTKRVALSVLCTFFGGGGGSSVWCTGTNIAYLLTDCVGIGTATPGTDIMLRVQGDSCYTGDLKIGGDVCIGGDDLFMGTNTSGHMLIADGTNFNPVAMSGDVGIDNAGATTIQATSVENSMLAGSIANAKLSNSSISYGGISLALGATDATPAFNLCDATAYKTSNLAGTITNSQLAGSIANAKLANDSVSYGGVSVDLGSTDATPAFNLCDATGYPTSSLVGTITNAQLAGSIANGKLANDSVSYGGVSVDLGSTDATPAFNLCDATAYKGDSALVTVGTVTSGTWQGTAIATGYIAGTLASKTLSDPVLTGAISGDAMLDEDNMASDSATKVASQQSIKAYVDSVASGLDLKCSSHAATTANLSAAYNNGTSGVGATLTNSGTQAALSVDGQTMASGERVLVKDQSAAAQNGIYTVTTVGDGSSNWVLTRATDFDTSTEITSGAFTFVETGSSLADSGWVMTTDGTVTVGTTSLAWSQFSGAGQITAGNGMTKSGNTLNVGAGSNLLVSADAVAVCSIITGLTTVCATNFAGTLATAAQTNVTSLGTLTALTASGNVSIDGGTFVFNESGADLDFRIEGDTDANLFYSDASTDRIGIGTATPDYLLSVAGNAGFDEYIYHNGDADTYIRMRGDQFDFVAGNMTFLTLDESSGGSADTVTVNHGDNDIDFLVNSDDGTQLIRTDAENNRVGIGTEAPATMLHVQGDTCVTGNIIGALSTAAQTNITSLGTLTALTVDNICLDGTTIGHTSDTDLMTLADGVLTVSGRLDAASDIKVDAIRRYSDSSTTTKILLNDEVIKINAGHSSNEVVKIASGAVTIDGDLTICGDDLIMGTNTSGYLLVADGTNYNPVAMSGDIAIDNAGATTIQATSVENSMLAGSIANAKLANDSVSYGGVSLDLGGTDATPAFNLCDATAYKGDSALVTVGTITSGTWQGTDVGVAHGGTGLSTVAANTILTGNGTSALTAEANLTFDGSVLAVTGAVTMANAAGPTIVNEAATATNPTLIPNKAEVDTGIGWAAADSLTLITGGAERMRINASGYGSFGDAGGPSGVGGANQVFSINSTSTSVDFETWRRSDSVEDGQQISLWMAGVGVSSPNHVAGIGFYNEGTSENQANMRFYTSLAGTNTERMRITSSGMVGIGTTAPAELLTIANTSTTAQADIKLHAGAAGSASTVSMGIQGFMNTGSEKFYMGYHQADGSNPGDIVKLTTTKAGSAGINMDSSGQIGIGTSNPDGDLHVFASSAGSVTPSSLACAFVIESAGSGGMTLLSPDAGYGQILWNSPTSGGGLCSSNARIAAGYNGGAQRLDISVGGCASALTVFDTGNVNIASALSKGSGSFTIEHPLESKKDTHKLVHSFIEGPQADLMYRGVVQLVNGSVQINIDTVSDMTDGTFVVLNRCAQVFTTNESNWDAVRGNVSGNILTIESNTTNSTACISWMVVGERCDQHMMDTDWTHSDGRIIVEPEKILKG